MVAAGLLPVLPAERLGDHEALEAVHHLGCLHVTGVVSVEACRHALGRCEGLLREALKESGCASTAETPDETNESAMCAARAHFGDVLSPPHRRDLKVLLDDAIRAVVGQALQVLAPMMEQVLTADAELTELACLISDPGASAQPLHSDTSIEKKGSARARESTCTVLTAFIALQDIDTHLMGPTEVVPGSHCENAHEALRAGNRCRGGGAGRLIASGYAPPIPVLLRCGDVLLMDSRLVHRGGANEAKGKGRDEEALFGKDDVDVDGEQKTAHERDTGGRRRALLYVTFKAPFSAARSSFSMCDELKNGRVMRLRSSAVWCAARSEAKALSDKLEAISVIERERDVALLAIHLNAQAAIAKETEKWQRHKGTFAK
jgi:ectoine hydroxylase-related dioxygenase (phytanoyl-CoA dioxygenase family)